MDFSYLLDLAKQNEESAREAAQIKRYSTQVSASKKIPRSGVQSQAIQAFLAKKEQEEKKKKLEDLRKKEALLSLRAQDRKSNARVQAMLKRTKAANKAVLEDVKGALNSTITSNEQPDEDDYGYVSNEASAFYKKLINKYSVDEPNSANKGRERPKIEQKKVKDLPNRTEEKVNGKRSHSSKERVPEKSESSSGKSSSKEKESKKAPPKPPEAALSFDQILKLAATKQHQPIKAEKKTEVIEKKQTEDERPMTKKEREELMRRKQEERERQLRRLARESEGSSKSNSSKPVTPSKTKEDSKASTSKDVRKPNGVPSRPLDKSSSVAQKPNPAKSEPPPSKQVPPAAKGPVPSSSARPGMSKSVLPSNTGKSPLPPPQSAKPSLKGKAVPPSREPSRPFPPSREPSRPFPPSREQSRPFPPYRRDHSMERPVQSYKRSIESDEEYDSELDDFIDDGPDETEDYSKHIREIFGYDRSKYRRIVSDDEDECMESSFAQQMREERISTRIGIMEDLEEERLQREEEERKRKLAAKKTKTRK